jgi:hypothetical protein
VPSKRMSVSTSAVLRGVEFTKDCFNLDMVRMLVPRKSERGGQIGLIQASKLDRRTSGIYMFHSLMTQISLEVNSIA